MIALLVDTGPLVAYLDSADPEHERVAAALESFTGLPVTTSAVITEAMHLVGPLPGGPRLLAEFATATRLRAHDLAQPADLRRAAELMARYPDLPMDYADATLLILADQLGIEEILTLDRRGFSAYRTPGGEALRQVLDLA